MVNQEPRSVDDIPLAELEQYGLSQELLNTLEWRKGYIWLGQLLRCEKKEIATLGNVGEKKINLIISAVLAHRKEHKW